MCQEEKELLFEKSSDDKENAKISVMSLRKIA